MMASKEGKLFRKLGEVTNFDATERCMAREKGAANTKEGYL